MNETQQTVAQWAHDTFGNGAPARNLIKLRQELDELENAMGDPISQKIGSELADVQIMLWQIAQDYDLDIQEEVNKKMAINRGRVWEKQADGTYQHKGEQ